MAEHDERRFIILPPDDNLWCSQRRRFSSRFSRPEQRCWNVQYRDR